VASAQATNASIIALAVAESEGSARISMPAEIIRRR
jgi:hypothetical protein